MSRPPTGLLTACLAYLLLRGLILHTAFDEVGMPAYELYPMGTLPRMLSVGTPLPLSHYYDNAAGQLLISLLTVPVYAVLGPSYLALKTVPLALGLGTLVLLWALVDRLFGRRAAALAAWSFAIGPTTLVKYSVMASGNHFENLFFTTATAWAFFRLHTSERRGPWLVATGFAAGFALFVFLGALTAVGLFALLHVGLVGWRRALRDARLLVPGFLAGLAPLVLVNAFTGGRGLAWLGDKFLSKSGSEGSSALDPGEVWARATDFLGPLLARSGTYPDLGGLPGELPEAATTLAFWVAWLCAAGLVLGQVGPWLRGLAGGGVALRVADEPGGGPGAVRAGLALAPFVLSLPLTALAYGLSDLRVGGHAPPIECAGYRYFLPHLLFAALLVPVVADRWIAGGGVARVGGLVLAALPLAAGAFHAATIDWSFSSTGLGAHYAGTNVKQTARTLVAKRNDIAPGRVREYAEGHPPWFRERVYHGLGFYGVFAQVLEGGGFDAFDLDAVLAAYPPERGPELARGAGVFLRLRQAEPGVLRAPALAILETRLAAGAPYAAELTQGVCTQWPPLLALTSGGFLEENVRLLGAAPPALAPHVARGHGAACGRLARRGIPVELAAIRRALAAVRPEHASLAFEGFGEGLADASEELDLGAAAAALVPREHRAACLAAFVARANAIWPEPDADALARARERLSN